MSSAKGETVVKDSDEPKITLRIRIKDNPYGNHEDELEVDIDPNWKVTFGPMNPGTKGESKMALRIYESETKQRACFANVVSFRDISIPVRKRSYEVESETVSSYDDEGNSKSSSKTTVDREWKELD